MKYGWILLFWVLYVIAQLCFKFGSTDVSRWWPSFAVGSVFGITATLVLMKTYIGMNANIVLALCVGGGFLLAQMIMFLAFRSQLSLVQVVGVLAIALGMTLLVMRRGNVEQSPRMHSSKAADGFTEDAQE